MDLRPAWLAARAPADVLHLDSAAAGRPSIATRVAVAAHADREAERGAYVAELEAADLVRRLRRDLGGLVGLGPDDLALVESASAALGQLLRAWPLAAGDVVACAASEWGPNLLAFRDLGLEVATLPVDGAGVVDVDALPAFLARTRPALVHVAVASAHRALVQPAREVVEACRASGVPVLADLAQALGQVRVDDLQADAVYGTGRKWLAGPRGVGFLGVHPETTVRLRPAWPAIRAGEWPGETAVARRLESREAHVAGRLGLASAVQEHLELGPERVYAGLAEVGRRTREALQDLPGWTVCDAVTAPGAVTTLVPPDHLECLEARARLLVDQAILSTVGGVERAPGEMTRPTLRLSPHLDTGPEELDRLRAALQAVAGG